MRHTLILTFLVIISGSCGEKVFTGDVDCDTCYTEEPSMVDLEIEVTLRGEFPAVPLVIYKGDVEDGQVVLIDTVYENPYYVSVQPDTKYSAKASYVREDATLYAVDGTKPKVLRVTEACEFECYVIEDATLNLSINKAFLDF